MTAWWELPATARYLREHLLAAGRVDQAEEVTADLRWAGAQLQASGPAGPYADLALIGTLRAERLRRALGQAAHLLAPTEPPYSLIDILCSRVSHDPDWAAQAEAYSAGSRKLPALLNKWPLPDLPDPALRRTLTGHTGQVAAVAIAPDGSWLASADDYGAVRIWDSVIGQQRAILLARLGPQNVRLPGHDGPVTAVAIAPDGSWLASGGDDGWVRIWDPVTGQERVVLVANTGGVRAVAIAPDGGWLASLGDDGSVRICDPATSVISAIMRVDSRLEDCAWSPSSQSLAVASGVGLYHFTFKS